MASKEETKEFINRWTDRIKAGIEFRDKYSTHKNWKDYRNMYRNKWEEGVLPVNKIYSYGRMLIPRVYFSAPRVSVTATSPDMVVHARVVEAIDNMLIREMMLKETLKKSSLDAFLCGVGPIKLGFDSEFGYDPEQAIDESGETVTQVGQKDGKRIEYHETIKPGMPWAMRCRPEDIVVPWGSDGPNNLPWIAHRIIRPLEDVKQDQKYSNTKELKGTRTIGLDRGAAFRPNSEKDKDTVYAELWEIRDYKSGRILTICEDALLLDEPDSLQIEGLPYEFISFNPDPEWFWSIPDADILQAQQKELNDISTQAAGHRAISLLKFLYKEGSISSDQLTTFLSGQIGPAVGIKGDDPIAATIMPFQPQIPPDLFHAGMAAASAMKESLGFSSNELGDFQGGSPRTATETMTVSQSFEQRVSERRDIVGDVLVRIVRKWNQMLFNFWSTEKVVRIAGPEGAESWVSYTGDQLRGEYFLNVDADSGMPIGKALKYQMANDLLMKFGGDMMIDQMLLKQIVLETYAAVDPRATQLLSMPMGIDPNLLGAARQPGPMNAGAGQGRGSTGGRSGSSPQKPEEFDSFKKRFEQK